MPEVSRREVLVGGIAAAGLLSAEVSANEASSTSWIDAHSHIWTPDTSRFRLQQGVTTDDLAPRSFDDRELMTIARPLGVERVVLIQHTLFHGFDNLHSLPVRKLVFFVKFKNDFHRNKRAKFCFKPLIVTDDLRSFSKSILQFDGRT